MDTLDKWTISIIAAIAVYAGALIVQASGDASPDLHGRNPAIQAAQVIINPELDKKIELARTILIQGNVEKSETLVNSLLEKYRYDGRLYMLKGDILVRRQQPVAAMYEYKEAVEMNPDFLDKKTELFQGKKIKITVEEAMTRIAADLERQPDDIQLRNDRETAYYMKRKIAGSCG
jgi:Flp pilus assembly protein TadD